EAVDAVGPKGLLRLWEEEADGDVLPRAGAGDALEGRLPRQVLLVRLVEELIEGRVVEHVPPAAQVDFLALDSRVLVVDPLGSRLHLGLDVIRPDLEAVREPLGEAAATKTQARCEAQSDRDYKANSPTGCATGRMLRFQGRLRLLDASRSSQQF